jgi:hypothetical protein
MRQRWVYVDGVAYEIGEQPMMNAHQVMNDIEPFQSPDGAWISGRSAWREHLKRTDSIEMGHSDIKAKQQDWQKRKQQHRDRLRGAVETVQRWDAPGEIAPVQRSGLAVEMANRLHGRQMPERKEMIKLTLDIAKRMNRGR